jgi:hypothetical protein
MLNENKLLLECIKFNFNHKKIKKLLKKTDFDYLLNVARTHGVEQLLYYRLKGYNLKINKKLSEYYYGNTARNIIIYNELKNLVNILNKNKIDFLVLKGTALAVSCYKNIALRQMSDIDISIKIEDKEKLKKILKNYKLIVNEEYEKKNNELQYIKRIKDFKLLIEFSWDLRPLYVKDYFLFKNNKKIFYKDFSFNALKDEDNIIFLITHLKEHHNYYGLHWLADLDWLISKKIDYGYLIRKAKKYNKLNELYFTLFLINNLFKTKTKKIYLNNPFRFINYLILKLILNNNYLFNTKKIGFDNYKKRLVNAFFEKNFLKRIKGLYYLFMHYFFG